MPKVDVPFTAYDDFVKFMGLDYQPPKKTVDCFKEVYKVVPFLRNGVKSLMGLSGAKR
jgi:hypothetical protein